ncbi:alpha/beta hydrolase [Microvirga sp. STR05]|uniref:Alpha/beta hydrolase n=2 Tax=Hymenobacter TaxID=89966 RepID=A0A7G7WBN4_9BACT|nr:MULTISPECIES: alpha/beta hydrolase-fold protein [Hymenobacter]MBD2716156.1 alpha/beta hydrolase [Hymenobacter duratus]MBR7951070.1 alpha/beta hydrolase [Microvirga sp. STR05]QNH63777.1 alpha/beta hydrolase [Hymenobacter sediminicola]
MSTKHVFCSFLLLLLVAFATPATAQTQTAAPLSIGQTFTLESKVLGETRRINVYRSQAYGQSADMPLPVLYMPDGGMQEDFLHVAGLLQVGVGNETVRPFLLVGIENTERRRDMTGPTTNPEDKKIAPRVGGSAAFRQFIRTELMPEIKRRYRTTSETAVVGESLAGLFVVETLLLEPTLFDTYLAFDPSLWWNNEQLLKQSPTVLAAYAGKPKTLYLASSNEPQLATSTALLAKRLETAANRSIMWYYKPLPEETHGTIYHPAALLAFRTVLKPVKANPAK